MRVSVPVRLSSDKKEKMARDICDSIAQAREARSELDSRLEEWQSQYDSRPPSEEKTFPWPGAANLYVPLSRWAVDAIQARLLRVLVGVTPLWVAEPRGETLPDEARRIEELTNATAINEMELPRLVDDLLLRCLVDGTGILKVVHGEDRRTFRRLLDREDGSVELVEEETVLYAGPKCELVPLRDFYVLPNHASSVTQARGVAQRFWSRFDSLKRREAEGVYQDVERLRAEGGDERQLREDEVDLGLSSQAGLTFSDREFELFEVLWREDIDGDGLEEELLVTVYYRRPLLLRAEHYPYFHTRRMFIPFSVMPKAGSIYGASLCELLSSLQHEINAIHNQRVDSGTIANTVAFMVRRGADFDPERYRFYPGAVLDVGDIGDIQAIQTPDVKPSSYREEELVREYAERLSGISDYSLGRPAEEQRTATEVTAVLQEGNLKFQSMIDRLQEGMKELAEQVQWLLVQFMPDTIQYGVDVSGQPKLATREVMRKAVRFVPRGGTITANREIERQTAMWLYQLMLTNPLVASDPAKVYALTKRTLEAYGIEDPEQIIGQSTAQAGGIVGGPGAEQGPIGGPMPAGGGTAEGAGLADLSRLVAMAQGGPGQPPGAVPGV